VEALFEGTEVEVKSMLKWCEIGPPLAHVRETTVVWEPYTGEFDTFEITFG
jgi:acylphosphatase